MIKRYDVIIIGSGIGGLVAGCYLAKEGLKVLMVEQHDKPGGYCTSFTRKGYRFDVGVHYLGGVKDGILGRIIAELNIKEQIKLNQFDPTDKIVMPDTTTYIRAKPNDTMEELKKTFPNEEHNITRFFDFVLQKDFFEVYKKVKKLTFTDALNIFFQDYRLKSTLGALLCNIGLPPGRASAFASIVFYREFILDPGYYPTGGMQTLATALAKKFEEYKGVLLLNNRVNSLLLKNNQVDGVILEKEDKVIKTKFVISNADATETFTKLLKQNTKELATISKLEESPSIFALYIGTENNLPVEGCNVWKFNTYDLDKCFFNLEDDIKNEAFSFFMISFPSKHSFCLDSTKNSVQILLNAPYISYKFWNDHRVPLMNKIILEAEKIVPSLRNNITLKITGTPLTFLRYTSNKNGSAFGWASTTNQMKTSIVSQITSVKGLYLAGHWCMIGSGQGGIPKVAFSGKKAAELILKHF